ncbi:MAG: hypothetical protein HY231_23815 [Acidobacteria bacterium]|nr:hypothetical protein [Acidobacteriota bacterium]
MLLTFLNSLHSDSYLVMLLSLVGLWLMGTVFSYPGVVVTESQKGAIPINQIGFQTGKFVGTALRGPVNVPILITRYSQFVNIFGPRTTTSYLHDAVRMWFENVDAPCMVVRAINSGAVKATKTLIKAGVAQVETATVVGTIGASGAGNATVIVTSAGMSGSPITLNVAVANNDTASQVATKIRTALNANATIAARFTIGGSGADITLTRVAAAANDATLNVSIDNGTCTGLTSAPTSANTTAGVADVDVLRIDSLGPGADYNYAASPPHGISFVYVDGVLSIYDAGQLKEQYRNVTYNAYGAATNFINGHSERAQITWLDTTMNPDNYSSATGLASGADGTAVTATQIVGSESASPKTGIYAFARNDLGLGFLMAPGYTTTAVGNALIDVAERFRHLALVDSTFGNSTSQAITERNNYASTHGRAVYCYGWVQVVDQDTGGLKWVPRSPIRAAHIARSHSQPGGIANVGAGVDYTLRNVPLDVQNGAVGLETDVNTILDDLTQGELNIKGIDVARNFASQGYGLVHWAARTISPEVLFQFLHVPIILSVIAESVEIGLKPFVFRVVDGQGRLASEIKGTIDGLLWNLWNDDSLFGRTSKDAFHVKLHSSFTELEQGIIKVDIFVKPVPIAERIDVTLFRVALGYDFKTGEVKIGDAELLAAAA